MKVNTEGYGGREVAKRATVYTNDPQNGRLVLTIRGEVESFAEIRPPRIVLRGEAGSPVSGTAAIVPLEKYPFSIVDARARTGNHIRFDLSENSDPQTPGYVLSVENTKTEKGRYYDQIILKTDSRIKPEIRVGVSGTILAAPSQATGDDPGGTGDRP